MWYVSCAKLCQSGADTLYTDIYDKIYDCHFKSAQKLRRVVKIMLRDKHTARLQPVFQTCETIHSTSNPLLLTLDK